MTSRTGNVDPQEPTTTEESFLSPEIVNSQQLKGKKLSCQNLRRYDSLDQLESGKISGHHAKVITLPPHRR